MEKVIVWIKERLFLVALILFGVIYLTVSGEWRVYTEPFVKAGAWFQAQFGSEDVSGEAEEEKEIEKVEDNTKDEEVKKPEPVKPDVSSGNVSANDVSSGDVSDGDVSDGDVSKGDLKVNKTARDTVSDNDSQPDAKVPEGDELETKTEASDISAGKHRDTIEVVSGGDVEGFVEEEKSPISEETAEDEVVYETVEEDYFEDALFIGDSRTVGMYEYGDLKEIATFYATTGLTIHKVLSAPLVEMEGRSGKLTIEEALQEKQFAKIYFMLGINEMGTGTVETFMDKYTQVIERIKELQPEATIYVQGIMKVTDKRSSKGDYIHNEGIEARNVEIAKLADNKQVFYLDMNEVVCDENGALEPSYTGDGVHLKAQYFYLWKDYLLEHAVVKSR